jgi:hypothetical protein
MINANKHVTRILLVSIVILTSIYLFTTSFHTVKSNNNQDQHLEGYFDDDYFAYSTSSWSYENPTNITHPHIRFKAAFVTFVKSDSASLAKLRLTIRNLEDQFNKQHHYPYIIFTDQELSEEYMELASSLVSNETTMRFEKVTSELYGYPVNTDLEKAAQARIDFNNTMFGDSEDYRFQSRFMAGTIYRYRKVCV